MMRVRTVSETAVLEWFEALKEADEPCVSLKLYAHGSHSEPTGRELHEALLIPASVLEGLATNVATDDMQSVCKVVIDLAQRLVRAEDRIQALEREAPAGYHPAWDGGPQRTPAEIRKQLQEFALAPDFCQPGLLLLGGVPDGDKDGVVLKETAGYEGRT